MLDQENKASRSHSGGWEESLIVDAASYREALDYLRGHAGFDIDELLVEITADDFLARPLGPSLDCLSTNEVADYVAGKLSQTASLLRRNQVEHHLANCLECQENVALFQGLKRYSHEVVTPRWEFEIYPANSIRVPIRSGQAISLIVVPSGGIFHAQTTLGLDPASLTIRGVISGRACKLEAISDRPELEARGACRVQFRIDSASLPDVDLSEVWDWIEVEGKTATGDPFVSKSLIHFLVP